MLFENGTRSILCKTYIQTFKLNGTQPSLDREEEGGGERKVDDT